MENIKDNNYIVPIFVHTEVGGDNASNSIVTLAGNGFYIDDFFITAYHVIEGNEKINGQSNPFIIVDGKEKELTLKDSYRCMSYPINPDNGTKGYEKGSSGDVAIFKMPGVKSDLVLADSLPRYGDTLDNIFYYEAPQAEGQQREEGQPMADIYCWPTKGQIFDEDGFLGNFFGAQMTPIHPKKGGSSGSPLFKGNVVYGVLHAGNTSHPEYCIFFSAQAIRQLISNS